MQNALIGRKEEQETLLNVFASKSAEMVAVFGRRRVGKTFLVKQVYQEHITFEITGLQNASNRQQLKHFAAQIAKFSQSSEPIETPSDWLEAFYLLARLLDKHPKGKRQVVFLDGLPWLEGNNKKSSLVMGLGWFWNSWAERRNVVLVISGSPTSWLIHKIINDRGGLHNRVTKRIFLKPLTLSETEIYLKHRDISLDRYQIVQIYMAMGGIPYYLNEIKGDKIAVQNIQDICFAKNGLLHDEFTHLYAALFPNFERHIAVIKALAQAQNGLPYATIVKNSQLSETDNPLNVLEELEKSEYIDTFYGFDKRKREVYYRLTDPFSLFYLRCIEPFKDDPANTWQTISQTPVAKSWAHYAYTNACAEHLFPIKKGLGVWGVYSPSFTFQKKARGTNRAVFIDLLIDRNDRVVNILLVDFGETEFVASEANYIDLRHLRWDFERATKTKKRLEITLVTTFGIQHNQHSLGTIEKVLTLDTLFL